jgi:phage shock protein C
MEERVKKSFRLDRANGKIMGVCAGLANYLGVDVTFVRVGAVLVTLLGAFPWTLIAYGVAAYLAKSRTRELDDATSAPAVRGSLRGLKETTRDSDRRLAEVDSYVAQADSRLAREIEELR